MDQDLSFEETLWYGLLSSHGQRLVRLSSYLYEREVRLHTNLSSYSFVVFPMAKAYEGFLKTYLHEMQILPKAGYEDHKFRIGRAMNPDISERHKDEWWLYDDLERVCSRDVARGLWDAWIECRNRLFHFYFDDEVPLPLPIAKKKLLQMHVAMEKAMQCLRAQ